MSDGAIRGFIDEAALVLSPLLDVESPDDVVRLLAKLGWTVASVPAPIADLTTAGADLLAALDGGDDATTTEELLAAIAKIVDAIEAIRARPDNAFPGTVDVASFKATIGRDLLDYCVVEYLLRYRVRIGRVLKVVGIVQVVNAPGVGRRQPYVQRRVDWSRIGTLLTDPLRGVRESYDWTTGTPEVRQLVGDVAAVLESFGLQYDYVRPRAATLAFLNAGATTPLPSEAGIRLVLDQGFGAPAGHAAGLDLFVRAPTATRGSAIAVLPFIDFTPSAALVDDDSLSLAIVADADFAQGIALTLAPGHAPVLEAGFVTGTTAPAPSKVQVQLKIPPGSDQPERVLIGTLDSSHVSMHTLIASAGAVSTGAQLEAFAEFQFDHLRIVIKSDDSDSFIGSLIGDGVSADLSLGIRVSSVSGFHFTGSGGLEVNVPVSVSFGPIALQGITIGLHPNAEGIVLAVGATIRGSIGPVTALTDGVGFTLGMTFPDPPTGNLGPIDVGLGFKPPSGIGLSVDAGGVVSGGGFLFHDPVQQLYAGVMQLSLNNAITLTAFGLIATRLPDGSPGYSLLVFITAEDFKAIPLGMGFTLLGIGGMVGVNRSFDQEVLRQGLKNDTLGTLLFPRDAVANAPALIRSLAAAFPARAGSYLLGILVKIGWFTPTLVLLELALILEFGARKRLLVLGRISALLPSPDNDLIRLKLDAIGVIDFDQDTAAIDAVLVDSRLAHAYALTGAMALRANWGAGPGSTFVLAVGGLHPRFAPPSDLPKLDRIAIALSSGNNPRLTCESYFAITANTVQFGARASLYAAAYGFSVEGDIGYDVLLQIVPLHFVADFHAKVALKRGSSNLFSVSLEGELEGPRPLRVSGKASFEIFWCDFSVRFDKTLVDGEAPPLPPAVDLLGDLTQALSSATSWSVQSRSTHGVALRKLPPGETLVLDPLGTLIVQQQVAPLNTGRDIDTYGGAPVAGAHRFQVAATLQNQVQSVAAVRGQFAPAQYFTMTDDEKLAAPSFEEMDAGIAIGSTGMSFDEVVPAPLTYEAIVIDTLPQPAGQGTRYVLAAGLLMAQTKSGAVARAAIRRAGQARFRQVDAPPAATLSSLRWTIMPLTEGAAASVDPGVRTWSEYRAALATLNRGAANWQMVPTHELAA